MARAFLDTNVVLRFLTQDSLEQAEQARTLLLDAEDGQTELVTCEGAIVEVVQVLSSKALYDLPRADIREHLDTIIGLPRVKLPNKGVYLRALELYVQHPFLDFVDALQVAHMERQGITEIASFDHDFDRIPGIRRLSGI